MRFQDILGINARNLEYIQGYNSSDKIDLVDSKLLTKKLLLKNDIPVAPLYSVIKNITDFESVNFNKLPQNFVVKPNRGFGGSGILVLKSSEKKEVFSKRQLKDRVWVNTNGEEIDFDELKSHILDILYGKYSLSNAPDIALIEKKVNPTKEMAKISGPGVSDIRVIAFNMVPVMAMLRMPTKKSNGRANLATGGIGLGVDVGSGKTTKAFVKKPQLNFISRHPDTNQNVLDLQIPEWDKILHMVVESQKVSGLGFLGVDIVVDRRLGPLILELNARPGLGIQNANLDGLRHRLERVKGLKISSVKKGVRVGKELFGGDIERRVEGVSGKEVVGLIEEVLLVNSRGTKKITAQAKIDTGAESSSIDIMLAKKLGFTHALKIIEEFKLNTRKTTRELETLQKTITKKINKEGLDIVDMKIVRNASGASLRPTVKLILYLEGQKIRSEANIVDRKGLAQEVLVGKKDLSSFLIDPQK